MWWLFVLGVAFLVGIGFAGRWYGNAKPSDIAFAIRTFFATLSGLAGTGLLITGRFGLALILLIATAVTLRTLRNSRRGADPWEHGPTASSSGSSEVETDLLSMRLDRATGSVEGRVKSGPLAGKSLDSLALGELLDLLAEARRTDQESIALVEAFLDRTHADWRDLDEDTSGAKADAGDGDMTIAQALEILGLEADAGAEEIKAAHRRLMAQLHPDRGGSTFLATQVNRAKEILLRSNTRV